MTHKFILIVEEDQNLSHSIALILQHAGYLVTVACTAQEASDRIRSRIYHLVILDTAVPEVNQFLLSKVLVYYPYLSIVILTDRLLSDVESEIMLSSAQYLVKPIDPKRLLDCVRSVLGQNRNYSQVDYIQ